VRDAEPIGRWGVTTGLLLAALGWTALLMQFVLISAATHARGDGWWLGAARFFGFFTILTNTFVAAVLSAPLMSGRLGRALSRYEVRSAALAYIAVVGLIYSVALRQLWNPEGMQKFVDVALHDVIPVAYLVHWTVFVSRGSLPFRVVPRWLVYPLVYSACALIIGALGGWYPYPFIDAGVLGYRKVGVNVVGLALLFVVMACVVVGLDRLIGRARRPVAPAIAKKDSHA
jgi:hypothetical protein